MTLHLPLDWYAQESLRPGRADLWLHGVSESQCARASPEGRVEEADRQWRGCRALPPRRAEASICRVSRPHLSGERRGSRHRGGRARPGCRLIIAGQVFAYEAHRRYFREQVEPRLGAGVRFIGAVGPSRKRRLLAGAHCLLAPSLAEETSSLVAMEALACGTPVVAFRRGALAGNCRPRAHGLSGGRRRGDGRGDPARARRLDVAECRGEAVRRFSADAMIQAISRSTGRWRRTRRAVPCSRPPHQRISRRSKRSPARGTRSGAASPTATPFQSPAWLIPWQRVFAPGELRCAVAFVHGRLVALVPFYLERGRLGGGCCRSAFR